MLGVDACSGGFVRDSQSKFMGVAGAAANGNVFTSLAVVLICLAIGLCWIVILPIIVIWNFKRLACDDLSGEHDERMQRIEMRLRVIQVLKDINEKG